MFQVLWSHIFAVVVIFLNLVESRGLSTYFACSLITFPGSLLYSHASFAGPFNTFLFCPLENMRDAPEPGVLMF